MGKTDAQFETRTSSVLRLNRRETLVVRIQPSRRWGFPSLGEIWHYRELLYFLVWRDVKVRYKQTVLGAAWAVLQPFLTMVVFSLFFGRFAGIPSGELPYPVFSYVGLLPWTLFSQGINQAGNSLAASAHLVTKVYFPRLLIPLAAVLALVVDFAIAFGVLLGMMLYYRIVPTSAVLWFPGFFLLALLTTLAVGLWLAALNAQYRDVRYVVPFLTQLWLFATPVIYPSFLLQGVWRVLLGLNPMTTVVEGMRWALLGVGAPPGRMVWASVGVVALLLITGLLYFRHTERTLADVV
ncbi:MAG: ABC transporter permease [Candidatus Bipolaricaulota bacterium]|nr:ABC transporter permease [Candidatus Bipolaricaulota bacterium]